MSTADTNAEDLAARVERLEAAVVVLQAQLAASIVPPRWPPAPTPLDLGASREAPAAMRSDVAPGLPASPALPALPALPAPPAPPALPAPPGASASAARTSEEQADGIEAAIGTYWLSRLGIAALVTGIAWFIAIRFGDMSPALRVVIGYGIAAAITAGGAWLARRHARLGHVVLGGGLAVGYFVTYALHFIAEVKMIDEPLTASILLAMVVAAIVAVGQRLRSETVVGVALFLGFHTSRVGELHVFALGSTTLLAAAAAYVFVRNRWVFVPLFAMLAVYASHALSSGVHHAFDVPSSSGVVAFAFLVVYFVLFAAAALFQPPSSHPRWSTHAPTISIAIGNVVLFASFGLVATIDHAAWLLPILVVSTLLFAVTAAVAQHRGAPLLVATHLAAAVPFAAGILAEVLPSPVAATAIALLGVGAARWSVRRGATVTAISAQLTMIVALGAFVIQSGEAFVAPLVLGVALIACARAWRDAGPQNDGDTYAASVMRSLAAGAAGLAGIFASHAVLERAHQTMGWVVVSLVLIGAGLASRERVLRFAGLAVLALAVGKLLFLDLARLPTDQRILTFVASGVMLLALSYAYTRFRGRLQGLL